MGIFRPSRSGSGADPFLVWKVRLFVIGAGLGFIGMITELPAVLWAGVAVLFVGVALRFRASAREVGEEDMATDDE